MNELSRQRNEPITVGRDDVVQTQRNPYLLHHHEFLQLTKIHSFLAIWAHSFFAGTGVFLVTIIARLVDNRHFDGTSVISRLEWITLGILVLVVLVFEGAVWFAPSAKKKTIKNIQRHFDRFEN